MIQIASIAATILVRSVECVVSGTNIRRTIFRSLVVALGIVMRCTESVAQPRGTTCDRSNDVAPPKRGVTIIEAILVILVLSGAAIASSFVLDGNWVSNHAVKDATIEIAQTLDAARNTAVANRCNVHVRRVRVNGVEQLQIIEEAGPHRGEQRRDIPLGSDVTLRARPSEIEFTALGTAKRAANWTLTQGNVSGQIAVTPTTGRVTFLLP